MGGVCDGVLVRAWRSRPYGGKHLPARVGGPSVRVGADAAVLVVESRACSQEEFVSLAIDAPPMATSSSASSDSGWGLGDLAQSAGLDEFEDEAGGGPLGGLAQACRDRTNRSGCGGGGQAGEQDFGVAAVDGLEEVVGHAGVARDGDGHAVRGVGHESARVG